jgi:uncharacterized protein (TIGR03546 family)
MFYWLLGPIRIVVKALMSESSPRQLALGFAMGMVIGLVPKGNLIAVALMMILGASRVNVGVGMFSAFLFSWAGTVTDQWTHEIGWWLLQLPALQSFWTQAYNTPIVPWTAFNNTIVLGSLTLGLALFVPVYFLSRPFFEKYSETVVARLKKYRATKLLWSAEFTDRLGSI